MKVNLRMNLSHFLNKSYEEQVIQKLGDINSDSIKYYLNLFIIFYPFHRGQNTT